MKLRQLDMLLAVADSGGYGKAGANLNMSHTAIHRHIRLLERDIGSRLLVKIGRQVQLTDTGNIVVEFARRVNNEMSEVKRRVEEANNFGGGTLSVGTGTNTLRMFLLPIIKRFKAEFPRVELRLITAPGDVVLAELQNGSLDLGVIATHRQLSISSQILYTELYRDEVFLAVSKRHPYAQRRSITLAEAAELPLIVLPKGSRIRQTQELMFQQAGLVPTIVMELENQEAIEDMVAMNMGAAFLSKHRRTKDGLAAIQISGYKVEVEIGIVRRRTGYLPRAAETLIRIYSEAGKARSDGRAAGRERWTRVMAERTR
jgi:DNA-binding transcriptional LysR family regulator